MKTRPTSVTVISWILIAMGAISLITTTAMINNPTVKELMGKSPFPIPVQFAMTYAGLLMTIVAGSGMLKGFNWARLLYVCWSAIGSIIAFATSPMKAAMIPGVVVFLVITFFLFRPKATAFFSAAEAATDAVSA